MERNIYKIGKEWFITSDDEEIKEGDWFLDDNNSIDQSYKLSHVQFANPKKIILTTDRELIKDGVQAIDNEFLEWFVKNPSCEEVDVEQVSIMKNRFVLGYKIIIPKEESLSYEDFRKKASKELLEKFDNEASKRSGDGDFDNYFYGNCRYWENKLKEELTRKTDTCYNFNKEIGCVQTDCRCEKEEHKQETLEEAANNYSSNELSKLGFINGTKWQTERSYSEEDMFNFAKFCSDNHFLDDSDKNNICWRPIFKNSVRLTMKEMFEQFKKK